MTFPYADWFAGSLLNGLFNSTYMTTGLRTTSSPKKKPNQPVSEMITVRRLTTQKNPNALWYQASPALKTSGALEARECASLW